MRSNSTPQSPAPRRRTPRPSRRASARARPRPRGTRHRVRRVARRSPGVTKQRLPMVVLEPRALGRLAELCEEGREADRVVVVRHVAGTREGLEAAARHCLVRGGAVSRRDDARSLGFEPEVTLLEGMRSVWRDFSLPMVRPGAAEARRRGGRAALRPGPGRGGHPAGGRALRSRARHRRWSPTRCCCAGACGTGWPVSPRRRPRCTRCSRRTVTTSRPWCSRASSWLLVALATLLLTWRVVPCARLRGACRRAPGDGDRPARQRLVGGPGGRGLPAAGGPGPGGTGPRRC